MKIIIKQRSLRDYSGKEEVGDVRRRLIVIRIIIEQYNDDSEVKELEPNNLED